jgi:hypothetical protein
VKEIDDALLDGIQITLTKQEVEDLPAVDVDDPRAV